MSDRFNELCQRQHGREKAIQDYVGEQLKKSFEKDNSDIIDRITDATRQLGEQFIRGLESEFRKIFKQSLMAYDEVIRESWKHELVRARKHYYRDLNVIIEEKESIIKDLQEKLPPTERAKLRKRFTRPLILPTRPVRHLPRYRTEIPPEQLAASVVTTTSVDSDDTAASTRDSVITFPPSRDSLENEQNNNTNTNNNDRTTKKTNSK